MAATKTSKIRKGTQVKVIVAVRGAKVGAEGKVINITRHQDFPSVEVFWVKQADGWIFDAAETDLARA